MFGFDIYFILLKVIFSFIRSLMLIQRLYYTLCEISSEDPHHIYYHILLYILCKPITIHAPFLWP